MTSIFNNGAILVCIIILMFTVIPSSASLDPYDSFQTSQPGLPSSLPIQIPDGVGSVGEDGNLHVNLIEQVSSPHITDTDQVVSPAQLAGTYQDKTMKKTTGSDGSLFEGGADIDYTVQPDNSVSGTVAYKFIEQGWTIKVKGTVSGQVTPDGDLTLTSQDALVKYAGDTYPITMNVDAQYSGNGFQGTKVISAAGVVGTLGFSADKIV